MVTLSVWVGPNPRRQVQEELIAGVDHPLPETVAVIEEILRVSNIVKGSGFNGRPVGPAGHGVSDAPVAVHGGPSSDARRGGGRPLGAGRPLRASSPAGSGSTTR